MEFNAILAIPAILGGFAACLACGIYLCDRVESQ